MTTASGEPVPAGRQPRSRRSRVALRMAAVAFGLGLVVAAEFFCRLLGWGDPQLEEDPFVGFSGSRPLFSRSEDGQSYEISQSRLEYFAPESFPVEKPAQTRRIFCLGGSTVQGRPWSIATSFTTWLELALNVVDEEHEWDVINCGGISYASYRLLPILEECLRYDPDMFILCTGHNEFLEDRSYPESLRSPLLHRASQLRLINIARNLMDRRRADAPAAPPPSERATLPMEIEPILNFEGGLAAYHRDDPWREGIAEHYEFNVRRMARMVQDAGLPLLLMTPASNLRDCPPFKWELPSTFTAEQTRAWGELISGAQQIRKDDPLQSLRLLKDALAMDPESPLTHYQIGRTQLQLLDMLAARRAFIAARDLDVCPLRMPGPLVERLQGVADQEQVPLLDMHALLEARSRDGILGDAQLVDHIHPSVEGHQVVAEALLLQLSAMGLIPSPAPDWQSLARRSFADHLATLDSAYFLRGQRMLQGLRAWSQGRADGPAAAQRFPERIRTGE